MEAVLTDDMKLFNASVSASRISVEWLVGDAIKYFEFLDYKKNLKIDQINRWILVQSAFIGSFDLP